MNTQKTEKKIPDLRPGDIVRVYQKIREGGKEREQAFEGVIIKRSGGKSVSASFIVRKISQGIGVERKFLIHSPFLIKVQVKKRSKVKRADLSYLRNVGQIKKKLRDRKIEPFEESLVAGVKEEEKPAEETAKEEEKAPTPAKGEVGVPTESVGKEKPAEKKDKPKEDTKTKTDKK